MRLIERWFPCAEVSHVSASGWGSGKSERALFTWFAPRPLAQAKAAVLSAACCRGPTCPPSSGAFRTLCGARSRTGTPSTMSSSQS